MKECRRKLCVTIQKTRFWIVLIGVFFVVNLSLAVMVTYHHTNTNGFATSSDHTHFFESYYSSSSIEKQSTRSFVSEDTVWRRMLEEQSLRRQGCDSNITESQEEYQLPFYKDLQSYVNLTYGSTADSISHTTDADFVCQHATGSACHVGKYSVVLLYPTLPPQYATTRHTSPLRRLILHIMSFLSYPTVNGIVVVTQHWTDSMLKNDGYYGSQLLRWHHQGTIQLVRQQENTTKNSTSKITLLRTRKDTDHSHSATTQTMGTGSPTTELLSLLQQVHPKSQAMVWIMGNTPHKQWNGTSLKQSFFHWRAQTSTDPLLSSSANSMATEGQQVRVVPRRDCSIPNLHGLWMDRSYLCYLQHPMVYKMIEKVGLLSPQHRQSSEYEDEQGLLLFLRMFWNEVSGDHRQLSPFSQRETSTIHAKMRIMEERNDEVSTMAGEEAASTWEEGRGVVSALVRYFGCECSEENSLAAAYHVDIPNEKDPCTSR